MKKICILSICAAIGLGAFAQESVVKEAERAMKKGTPYVEVLKLITPAFSDPATMNLAQTYYIPGKAGYDMYDNLFSKKQFGQLPENGEMLMAEALIGGYENFKKALPLDSLPNAKGQVKPKYSKEIINIIAGHYGDLSDAGVTLFNDRVYDKAYQAWEAFLSIPNDPAFAKASLAAIPDSTIGLISYYQGLAAYQLQNPEGALKSFIYAMDKGYKPQIIYDQIIATAESLGKSDVVLEYAALANDRFGNESPNYIGYLINARLNDKDYPGALAMIDKAIAQNPEQVQYYVIKGVVYEQDDATIAQAKEMYAKALEVDPYNAEALYHNGRMVYNEAIKINDEAPTDDQEYTKVYYEQFKPTMLKAVDLFERAYNAKEGYKEPLRLLQQAYYMLNDESNLKYTEERLAE